MIVQTAWQNALYINPIEYSSILIIYHYKSKWIIFTIYTEKDLTIIHGFEVYGYG